METFIAYYRSPLGILKLASIGDKLTEALFTHEKTIPAGKWKSARGDPASIAGMDESGGCWSMSGNFQRRRGGCFFKKHSPKNSAGKFLFFFAGKN